MKITIESDTEISEINIKLANGEIVKQTSISSNSNFSTGKDSFEDNSKKELIPKANMKEYKKSPAKEAVIKEIPSIEGREDNIDDSFTDISF